MRDFREYKVLIETVASNGCVSQIWACGVWHSNLMEGIQNGGLVYFEQKRHKILDFKIRGGDLSYAASVDQAKAMLLK